MHPTPNICIMRSKEEKKFEKSNLECGEHFSLFFTVDQAVMILH
jgi:hypothetical protein